MKVNEPVNYVTYAGHLMHDARLERLERWQQFTHAWLLRVAEAQGNLCRAEAVRLRAKAKRIVNRPTRKRVVKRY